MSSKDWIEKRIENLIRRSEEFKAIEPNIANNFQSWTALKLIVLAIVVNFYTSIIRKYPFFENVYFIDALSGAGVCDMRDCPECVIGSPLLVSDMAGNFFSKMYFIEQNDNYRNALGKRLNYLNKNEAFELEKKNYEIKHGDANEKIPEIIEEIRKETNFENCNYLAFIDNQGFDVKWKAMSKLIEPYGDLLINFQTGSYAREWGKAKSGDTNSIKLLNEFFGTNFDEFAWSQVDGGDGLRNLYMNRLADEGREIQDYITIRSKKGRTFRYDMIYCTRKTRGGSPYIQVFKDVKPKIEKHTGDSVDKILKIMRGDYTSLDYFFPEKDKTEQKKLYSFES